MSMVHVPEHQEHTVLYLGVFLAQKLAGEPFTVVGTGEQTRDFTYVTDVADAFYTAAVSDVVNDTFNVGSGVLILSTDFASYWEAK